MSSVFYSNHEETVEFYDAYTGFNVPEHQYTTQFTVMLPSEIEWYGEGPKDQIIYLADPSGK